MILNGIDIIEINRIKSVLEKYPDKFLKRIYTKNELDYCKNKPNRLAARFAVKEAVMKTLGTGIKGVGWKDIETIRKPGEKPSVKLHNRALLLFFKNRPFLLIKEVCDLQRRLEPILKIRFSDNSYSLFYFFYNIINFFSLSRNLKFYI